MSAPLDPSEKDATSSDMVSLIFIHSASKMLFLKVEHSRLPESFFSIISLKKLHFCAAFVQRMICLLSNQLSFHFFFKRKITFMTHKS